MTLDDPNILNQRSLDSLLDIFASGIRTSNNLLVIAQELSALINYLTPFKKLKDVGKFTSITWLDTELINKIQGDFNSIIVIIEPTNHNAELVLKLARKVHQKVYIIVRNLSKSFLYQLNNKLEDGKLNFNAILHRNLSHRFSSLNSQISVSSWKMQPLVIDENVLSLEMPYGGLESYFKLPIEVISKLSNSFMDMVENYTPNGKLIKLRNIYALGDNASLVAKIIENEKFPDYLSQNLSSLEQQLYREKARGNTDLIVLERNLDYSSVAFTQLNYQGLIDDLFEINFNSVTIPEGNKTKLDDELFEELKDLNFASIGMKLNQMAKYIQNEYSKKDNLMNQNEISDLSEIKKLVSNLGPLSNKQELIKKHTSISESVLDKIRNDMSNPYQDTNQYEQFLGFQNDLLEEDYKTNFRKLCEFINRNFNSDIVISSLILISVVHDGIKEKDFETINPGITQNYGIQIKLVLNNLVKYHIIKIVQSVGATSEILGAFTSLSLGNHSHNPEVVTSNINSSLKGYENINQLGITAGSFHPYKNLYHTIDKFFNLHPPISIDSKGEEDPNSLYENLSFALPGSTVPLIVRMVQLLYSREALVYKPVNNLSRRPNWSGLELGNYFAGKITDINLNDKSDDKKYRGSIMGKLKEDNLIVIVVIGGITRGEISCLKYLERKLNDKSKFNNKILVLTSGVVNHEKLIKVCST